MTEIDRWVSGYKVRAFDWVDGKSIYMNIQYFRPGSSLAKKPAREKSVLFEKTPENEDRIRNYTDSVVRAVMEGN